MTDWSAVLALAGLVVMVGVPLSAAWAFRAGWFERSSQTRRSRHERRPTHGGLVVAVVLAVVAVASDVDGDARGALLGVVAIAVIAGHRAERDRGPGWAIPVGWVATGIALPIAGVRVELTGTAWADVLLTVVGAAALIAGLDAVDHTDGTAPAVAGVASMGLLGVAVDANDPVAVLAGGLAGACLGLLAQSWPPASVRIGAIGPMALGGALAIMAIEVDPSVGVPRSTAVPVLALGLLGLLSFRPRFDRELARRDLPPHLVLPLAGSAGAIAAVGLASTDLGLVPAVLLAAVPAAAVVVRRRKVPATSGASPPDPEPAPPGRRMALFLVPLGVVVVGGAVAAFSLISAQDAMRRGRDSALSALEAARAGDLDLAQARFADADTAFDDASRALGNPFVRLGDVVPLVAPNLRAARTMASVGGDLSSTAVAIANQAGADELRVTGGRFPIEQARAIHEDLSSALATLERATTRLRGVSSAYLFGELDEARDSLLDEVSSVTSSLEVATQATEVVPALLGADGDRRWIVAVLASSELRGAGGLLGDFAELRTSDGKVELVRSISAAEMNAATEPAEQATALPSVYAQNYGGYHPNQLWQNLSVTPDAVTMSSAIAAAYPLTEGGGRVDGVIALDATGMAAMLQLTGPVRVPDWPTPIGADNVQRILDFDQYDRLVDEVRDRFQPEVVAAVVRAMASGSLPPPSTLASALTPAVAGGHLRLWSADDAGQRLFRRIGADGALELPASGDFVQLVTQNGSESKIDWFLRRALAYEATFDPVTGELRGRATVEIQNTAPRSGVSDYIIGEEGGPTRPGESRILVTVITPHLPSGVTRPDGSRLPMTLGRENGLYTASVLLTLGAGATETVTFELEGALPPSERYGLTIGHQPTIAPDEVSVSVRLPPGWVVEGPEQGRTTFEEAAEQRFEAEFKRR